MRKLVLLPLLILLFTTACTSNTFEPEKEIVEVERVLEEVMDFREQAESIDAPMFEYQEKMELPITLKNFLYNYYELAEERDLQLPNVRDDTIVYHSLTIGIYPYVTIKFNYEDDSYTIREIACFKECTEEYQDVIVEALELDKMKYGKDYTIDEYYEESKDCERYDVFIVIGN